MGSRIKKMGSKIERRVARHILGRIFATFASILLKLPVYDTQCGAKFFSNNIAGVIFKEKFVTSWLFDVELLFRMKKIFGDVEIFDKIYELSLGAWKEVGGSRLKLTDFIKVPWQLFKIYKRYGH